MRFTRQEHARYRRIMAAPLAGAEVEVFHFGDTRAGCGLTKQEIRRAIRSLPTLKILTDAYVTHLRGLPRPLLNMIRNGLEDSNDATRPPRNGPRRLHHRRRG